MQSAFIIYMQRNVELKDEKMYEYILQKSSEKNYRCMIHKLYYKIINFKEQTECLPIRFKK